MEGVDLRKLPKQVRTYRLLQLGVSVTEQQQMSKLDLEWLLSIDAVYGEVAAEKKET